MTADEAVKALNALNSGDAEGDHMEADDILVKMLEQLAPKVADAYKACRERVLFWYA